MGKHLGVMREVRGKWREGMEQNKCKEEGRSANEGEGTLRKGEVGLRLVQENNSFKECIF